MYFKELNLKSFGKFKDKTIHLTNGLNIIYGVNESGKSTINKFITGIMYGFVGPSKKRTIYSSDHAKYTPWIGDAYVGSILVDLNGTNIRIERNFSKGNEQLNIYDLNNGNDLKNELGIDTSRKVEQVGKALLGLSETMYLNTLNIAPLETTNDNSYAIELRDILKNKSDSNIEDLSIQSSIQYLDNKQNELTKKTGPRSIEKEIQSLSNSIKLLYNSGIEYDRLTMELVKLNELVRNTEKDLLESRNAHQILNQINEVELHKKIDEIKIEIKKIEVNISKIPDFSFIDDDNYNEIERLFEERNRVENEINNTNLIYDELEDNSFNESDKLRFSVDDLDSDFATYTSANENIEATKDSKIYLVTLAISLVLLIGGFISSKILFIGSIVFLLVSIALYMKNSKLGNNIEIDTIGDIHTKYDVQDYESFRDLYYKEKAKIELINRQREIEYERVKKLGETKAKLKELDEKHESINSTLEILCSGQGIDNKQQFDSIKMYKNEYEKLVFKREQLMNSSENILRGRETTDISKLYEVNIEDKQKYESLAKNYENLKKTIDYNNSKRQNILGQMNKLEYDLDKLNDLTIKRENLNNALEDYNHKKYEIEETKKILNELSSVGNRGIMPMIVEKTEEFLSLVTENKYTKVLISDDHDIKIYDSKIDSYIDIDSLSTGTIDQVYLAYKLAVVDSLGDNLPIIFDDSFINYDDYRLENTLKGLSKIAKEHQIILFTCQIREENLLEKQNIEFNKIYL